MLVIREAQFAKFREVAGQRFQSRAVVHLQRRLPERAAELGRDALIPFVADCISRGRRYGFETERDLLKFLRIALVCGPDFEQKAEYSEAVEILGDSDYQPSVKLELIEQIVRGLIDR